MGVAQKGHRFKGYGKASIDRIPQLRAWTPHDRRRLRLLAYIFPFRVNSYQLDELIDWDAVPDDPIFRLTFPHPEMLDPDDLDRLESAASQEELQAEVHRIHRALNPHPAGQLDLNVVHLDGRPLPGIQHKYRETVLFFPKRGQTCPAYCTYCFRWPQFVGDQRIASSEVTPLIRYLDEHPQVTDLLITGGDPFSMRASVLAAYLEPILRRRPGGLATIRIGTKIPASWPYRFTTDPDCAELLRLLRRVVDSDYHLAVMVHYSHPRELSTAAAESAIVRLRETGAILRSQAPIVRHINDSPHIWSSMWNRQVRLGIVPYYMFIARDTGARSYFEIPLTQAHAIFFDAYQGVSGLGRTVRGPVMSATQGKVIIHGAPRIRDEKVFSLSFLQARDPSWIGRPFFARYDPRAKWFDDLEPYNSPHFFERHEHRHDTRPTSERRPGWMRPLHASSAGERLT